MNTGPKSEDDRFSLERTKQAFVIAERNGYLKCLSGSELLFHMFVQGMIFHKTGNFPEDLLNNKDFINNAEKYYK